MKKADRRLLEKLVEISGSDNVIADGPAYEDYSHDMADYMAEPAVVVRPRSEEEVRRVVELARSMSIPILARGAGSSLTGAAVLEGALVIDTRNMNRVLKVDTVNWLVEVQAGVSLEDLNKELKPHGFFFPPDPASSYICTVGGAIAEGSGGLRCVKYGTMKDWVVALRLVLANGRVARLGEPLAKNRAGYDLVHLVVGSEGTLGVVTEAYLKIIPIPSVKTNRFLLTFGDWESTGEVIGRLRSSKIMPHLFEFMDGETIHALNEKTGTAFDESEATLLVDVEAVVTAEATKIFESCGALTIKLAKDEEEAESFYQARTMAYLAVKSTATGVQVEDISLPIDRLGEYLRTVKRVAKKHGLRIPVNGHAGDGNVHPVILYEVSDPKSREAAGDAFEELCSIAIGMGGSVSGEHGIGSQKPRQLGEQLRAHEGEETLRLMKEIKKVFDPEGLMNPGKYVDAA
ncbi:MAG: FAD-binding oxidoreductase [Thaumarchaeota archaeon]|nr:FAD-binding oxidoreductase [Nitrososphaerota archaeon]